MSKTELIDGVFKMLLSIDKQKCEEVEEREDDKSEFYYEIQKIKDECQAKRSPRIKDHLHEYIRQLANKGKDRITLYTGYTISYSVVASQQYGMNGIINANDECGALNQNDLRSIASEMEDQGFTITPDHAFNSLTISW